MKQFISHPRTKKALVSLAVFLVVFTTLGFFVLPPIARNILITRLSEELGRNVSIQALRVNPYTLGVTVEGLAVSEPEGDIPFIRADEVYLNLEIASLFKGGAVINELVLKKPYLNIVRNDDATYNFSDLLKSGEASQDARFSVNNIQIAGGSIDFDDRPARTKHTLRDIDLTVPFISNLPHHAEVFVEPSFRALFNGKPLSFRGRSKPFVDSFETIMNLDITDLDLPYYLSYLPEKMNVTVTSGRLSTHLTVSYRQSAQKAPSLEIHGDLSLKELRINDTGKSPLMAIERFSAEVETSDVMAGKLTLKRLSLDSPQVWISMSEKGVLNLNEIMQPSRTPKTEKKGGAVTIGIRDLAVQKGSVHFSDRSREQIFKTDIEGISLTGKDFTTAPGGNAEFSLQAQSEADEQFTMSGTLSLEPLSARGTFQMAKLSARKYAPYYGDLVKFDVRQGLVDIASAFEYDGSKGDNGFVLSDLSAAVSDLKARKRGEDADFAEIPELKIAKTRLDLASRSVSVGSVSGMKGTIRTVRYNDGSLNLQALMGEGNGAADQPAPAAAADDRPWVVRLGAADLSRFSVELKDLLIDPPVNLSLRNIGLMAENISTETNSRGRVRVDLSLGKEGKLSLRGGVGINPPTADLRLNLRAVDLSTLFPYFADRVSLTVTDGLLNMQGRLAFTSKPGRPLALTYKGDLSVIGFDSVDNDFDNDLLSWENLTIGGLTIIYNPFLVKMDTVSVSDFYALLVINPDGTFNLLNILNKPVEADPEKVRARLIDKVYEDIKGKPSKDFIIEHVTLQGGTIDFSDTYIKPHFETTMYEVGGKIDGLSSEETAVADVDLAGRLENYAPLTIKGKINPLRDDFFVDIQSEFRNMDLSPMSPYSGKYVGYTIQKGKLSHRIEYKIDKRKLDASHSIFLDQLTLGDRVESPDATNLPVRLAIALLKDRRGQIEIDLPVSGSVDDPEFSVGRIVLKMILNLLVKAATAPFALLGSLFGGGEELSYIEFDHGQSRLSEGTIKKVNSLATALHERPSLALEIEGVADREKDSEGIKDFALERKVKAQKLKALVKSGQEGRKIDDIVVAKEEYEKYLKEAYKEEKFPKPRNILGIAKDLPAAEMEKLMRANINVDDPALRDLARRRAQGVKDALLKSGKVEQERIFVVQETISESGGEQGLPRSRANLKLR